MCEQTEKYEKDDVMNIYELLVGYSICCKEKKTEVEHKILDYCETPETDEYKHYVGVRRFWQRRIDDCDRAIDAVHSGRVGVICNEGKGAEANGGNQNQIPSEN